MGMFRNKYDQLHQGGVGGFVIPPPKGTRGSKRRFALTAAERAEELREREREISPNKVATSVYMTSPIIIQDTYNDI
jgi:hypothetical protein